METRHRPARSAVQAAKTRNVTMNRVPFCSCQHGAPAPLSRTFAPTAPGIVGCEHTPRTPRDRCKRAHLWRHGWLRRPILSILARAWDSAPGRKESAALTVSRPMMEPWKSPSPCSPDPTSGLLYQTRLFRGQRRGRIALSPGDSARRGILIRQPLPCACQACSREIAFGLQNRLRSDGQNLTK